MSFPFASVYSQFHPQAATPSLAAWQKSFMPPDKATQPDRSSVPTSVVTASVRLSPPTAVATSAPTSSIFTETDFPSLEQSTRLLRSTSNRSSSQSTSVSNTEASVSSSSQSVGINSNTTSMIGVNNVPASASQHSMITRSKTGIRKPNPKYALLVNRTTDTIPTTVAAALKDPRWNNAMGEEIDNCAITNTWSLVPRTPDMHVLGNKWIYRIKLNADGTVKTFRARIVAQGNNQEEGVDYL